MNEPSETVASDAELLANVSSQLEDLNISCEKSSDQDGGAVRKKCVSGKSKNRKKAAQNTPDGSNGNNCERRKTKKIVQPAVKNGKESFQETDDACSYKGTYLERQLSSEVADNDAVLTLSSPGKDSRTCSKAKTMHGKAKGNHGYRESTAKSVGGCETGKTEKRHATKPGYSVAETPDSANVKKNRRRYNKSSPSNLKFEPYIPLFEVQQGLKRGEFIEGALRINPRNYEDAYISDPDGQMDIYIGGMRDRNRALNGDVVVVQVKPKQEWKVLCDAIKDYQERSGQNVLDPPYSPAVVSPPCKVHTPEKLAKRNLASYGSWDFPGNERLPDTLEILGVDRLAKQYEEMSKEMKKKSRSRRHRHKSRSKKETSEDDNVGESGSQKSSGTSYSQGSSEDYLDRLSAVNGHSQQLMDSSPSRTQQLTDTVLPEKEEAGDTKNVCQLDSAEPVECNGCPNGNNESVDYSTFGPPLSADIHSQIKVNPSSSPDASSQVGADNPWISEESSFNLIITPDQLLDFEDGNSLQLNNSAFVLDGCESDGYKSDVDGVIVAPDDLSGDDFTDTCSIDSSGSQQIEQLIEDAEFLASQQDAQNNNADYTIQTVVNGDLTGEMKYSCEVISVNKPMAVMEAAVVEYEGDISIPSVVPRNLSYSSLISKDNFVGGGNAKDCCNMNEPVILSPLQENWKQKIETKVSCKDDAVLKKTEKKKKRRPKKSKAKEKVIEQKQLSNVADGTDISQLSVEDIMKHPLWHKFLQKTGKVVCIMERKHSCIAAGRIKTMPGSIKWALFSPNDARIPRMLIPLNECPHGFQNRPADFEKSLFIAEIINWEEDSRFACGKLIERLGDIGEIEAETVGILLENGVDYNDFPDEVIQCLPQDSVWKIPEEEYKNRRDFRFDCVFTIDPSTARDIDDALSCSCLDNGNYEIGVHIADVSYFVKDGTPLDEFARWRATSVYLVQKVIPMLPRLLCDNLCSLHPGQDKLTFSVVWEITPNCEIVNEWFGRSVINSCIKMSYEHAQDMIENPQKSWNESEHPQIHGKFVLNDIIQRVQCLHSLAVKLRSKRFVDGALRLDQSKLQFVLNSETQHPVGFSVYEQKDSNRLIEEFMLLANMSVARKINQIFPDVALLRRHPPPTTKMMDDVVTACADMGIHLDASSSGALQASLLRYYGDDLISQARGMVLTHLCSKPMNCALYFCSGAVEDENLFHHYALNVPLYTHFTSPIRRYPDIIVHRLLGAALNYCFKPDATPEEVHESAMHCNEKKYCAKKVSEQSAELFLAVFIRECGPVHTHAMVINVMDHSFDCLVLPVGIVRRVYCDKLPLRNREFTKRKGIASMQLLWQNGQDQTISMFSLVDVTLVVPPNEVLKINATLNSP